MKAVLGIGVVLSLLVIAQQNPQVSSKPLDELRYNQFGRIDAKLEALEERFHIREYQEQVSPLLEERKKLRVEVCKAQGVKEDKVDSACDVDPKPSKEFPMGRVMWIPAPPPPPDPVVPSDKKRSE